jgi:hypothetical protein
MPIHSTAVVPGLVPIGAKIFRAIFDICAVLEAHGGVVANVVCDVSRLSGWAEA